MHIFPAFKFPCGPVQFVLLRLPSKCFYLGNRQMEWKHKTRKIEFFIVICGSGKSSKIYKYLVDDYVKLQCISTALINYLSRDQYICIYGYKYSA